MIVIRTVFAFIPLWSLLVSLAHTGGLTAIMDVDLGDEEHLTPEERLVVDEFDQWRHAMADSLAAEADSGISIASQSDSLHLPQVLDDDEAEPMDWGLPQPSSSSVLKSSDAAEFELLRLSAQFGRALESASEVLSPKFPSMPWERGFAARVLGLPPNPMWARPGPTRDSLSIQPTMPVVATEKELAMKIITANASSWPVVATRLAALSWNENKESQRQRALTRWKMIVMEDPTASKLGRSVLKDMFALESNDGLMLSIRAVFSLKATPTLHKRSSALAKFMVWALDKSLIPFPVQEPHVFHYIMQNEKIQKVASAASAFIQALNFAGGLIGLDGALEAGRSPRVTGAQVERLLTIRRLKQALVLKVVQVRILHRVLMSDRETVLERIFCWFCLTLLYVRGRWSDGQHVARIIMDAIVENRRIMGYAQLDASRVKSGNTAAKRAMFLPMTLPLRAISREFSGWFQMGMELREQVGLEVSEGSPLLPCILKDGSFSDIPVSPSQGTKWLRETLLRAGASPDDVDLISTHSLKATTLSWCAKRGVDPGLRQILGYHVSPGLNSLFHYSRDNQAAGLRELESVLESIEIGEFYPDHSRSGYLRKKHSVTDCGLGAEPLRQQATGRANLKPSFPPEPHIASAEGFDDGYGLQSLELPSEEEPGVSDEVTSNSDSSSDSQSDVDEEAWANKRPRPGPVMPAKYSGLILWKHDRLGTIHKESTDDQFKLACGRKKHTGFSLLRRDPTFECSKCITCFGRV